MTGQPVPELPAPVPHQGGQCDCGQDPTPAGEHCQRRRTCLWRLCQLRPDRRVVAVTGIGYCGLCLR